VKGEAGSPYAITDYYDVNPYLATVPERRMEEFLELVERTHRHEIKVVMDFVPNHVARDYQSHVPGVRSLGADDDTSYHWSPENDFFYYPGEALRLPEPPANGDAYVEYPAKASGNCFSSAPGANDWYETIKLNYCNFHTGTWDKMYDIVRFWALKGVDGFRCDMVELVPPAFMQWLIARIKAVLRRCGRDAAEKARVVEFDGLYINMENYELKVRGRAIDTPPKEMELIFHLASNPNRVYTRNQLLDEVWGFDYFGDSRTVDVHIKRLREKVEDVSDQWALKTVWGVGYKFEVK
jgi:glycosidase